MDAAEAEVQEAGTWLRLAQEKLRQVQEHRLPELMDSLGFETFRTTKGLEVVVVSKIRASIGERKAEAFAWLNANGHSGLVKRTIEVAFNKGQEEAAADLQKKLSAEFAGVRQNMKVEPATLTSWVTKQVEAGSKIPMDLFGVFIQKYAKIKRPGGDE
jgi:hypothetical protein